MSVVSDEVELHSDDVGVTVPSSMGSNRSIRRRMAGLLFMLPLTLLLGIIFYLPLGYSVIISLRGSKGYSFANYVNFLTSTSGQHTIILTLGLALGATVASVLVTVPLALILRQHFHGRGFFIFIALIPAIIPGLVGAFGLLLLYDQTGWLSLAIKAIGIHEHPLALDYSVPGLIVFYVWMFFPYGALVILAGINVLDPEIIDAAAIHGARWLYRFRRIEFPLIWDAVVAGGVIIFLQSFGAFSVPLIDGGNYKPLAVTIFTHATVFLQWDYASAMAIITGILQLLVVLVFLRLRNRSQIRAI